MQKELVLGQNKEKILIACDDLKFDGKNIIIPSYYYGCLLDYIKGYDLDSQTKADAEDFLQFKKFLEDIEEYKANKYSGV